MDDERKTGISENLIKMVERMNEQEWTPIPLSSLYLGADLPSIDFPEIESSNIAEHMKKTEEYQKQSLELLRSIDDNTANLYTLVELISKSNEQQDEILSIVSEILSIAKAKEQKEAEGLFKKAIDRINTTVETAESMIKLIGWATSIYSAVRKILP